MAVNQSFSRAKDAFCGGSVLLWYKRWVSAFLFDISIAERFSQRPSTTTIPFLFDVSPSLPRHLVFPLSLSLPPFPGHSRTPKNECIGRFLPRRNVSTSGEWHQRGARHVGGKDLEVCGGSSTIGLHRDHTDRKCRPHPYVVSFLVLRSPSDLTLVPRVPFSTKMSWLLHGPIFCAETTYRVPASKKLYEAGGG